MTVLLDSPDVDRAPSLPAAVSVYGLGRCPYAKGATGNLATEDLLWMLHGLGCETGVDLPALAETTTWLADRTGPSTDSRVHRAMTPR